MAGLTYIRLFFGIDFTDESFYTAVPYRFVIGARPLIDETMLVQQTPGLLLYPFVKLYNAFAGLDGIILYARHLHFLFSGLVGLALYVALKRCLHDGALSALLAGIAVAFVPFGIHGLSYNTFASSFFAAGSFLGVAWLFGGSRRHLAIAGAAHGLAVFAYPPFALPVSCSFLALYLASHPRSVRALTPALAPAIALTLAALTFFIHDGIGTAAELIRHSAKYGGQGGGFDKAVSVASSVSSTFPLKYVAIALFVAAFALRRRPWLAAVPLLVLPVVALPPDLHTSASSNEFVTNFALLGPAVFVLTPRNVIARRLIGTVWLPAAIAGAVTAMSSSNGGINFAIGFFPAAIVTAALIAVVIRNAVPTNVPAPAKAVIEFAPIIALLLIGVAFQYAVVYRDASLSLLTTRIERGAYAGIYTTSRNRDLLATLERDLWAVSGPRCRIVFYDTFPAGYLLAGGRSDTNATWLMNVSGNGNADYQRLLLAYYAARRELPDIAVRVDRVPLSGVTAIAQTYQASDPLERLFQSGRYVTVRARTDYRIMRRRDSHCGGD